MARCVTVVLLNVQQHRGNKHAARYEKSFQFIRTDTQVIIPALPPGQANYQFGSVDDTPAPAIIIIICVHG